MGAIESVSQYLNRGGTVHRVRHGWSSHLMTSRRLLYRLGHTGEPSRHGWSLIDLPATVRSRLPRVCHQEWS